MVNGDREERHCFRSATWVDCSRSRCRPRSSTTAVAFRARRGRQTSVADPRRSLCCRTPWRATCRARSRGSASSAPSRPQRRRSRRCRPATSPAELLMSAIDRGDRCSRAPQPAQRHKVGLVVEPVFYPPLQDRLPYDPSGGGGRSLSGYMTPTAATAYAAHVLAPWLRCLPWITDQRARRTTIFSASTSPATSRSRPPAIDQTGDPRRRLQRRDRARQVPSRSRR